MQKKAQITGVKFTELALVASRWACVSATLAASFTLAGCAKDMDQASYDNEQAQVQRDKINAAAGVFTGQITSPSGANLGQMTLSLEGDSVSVAGSGNTTTMQALLKGSVAINNGSRVYNLSFNNGGFDSNQNSFTADVAVNVTGSSSSSSGSAGDVEISGTEQGDTVTGKIQTTVQQQTQVYGTFSLKRDGGVDPGQQLRSVVGTASGQLFDARCYQDPDFVVPDASSPEAGENQLITMRLYDPSTDQDLQFLNFASSVQTVGVQLTFKNTTKNIAPVGLQFLSASLDTVQNRLYGTNSLNVGGSLGTSVFLLDCTGTGSGWSCALTGPLYNWKFNLTSTDCQ